MNVCLYNQNAKIMFLLNRINSQLGYLEHRFVELCSMTRQAFSWILVEYV